MLVAAVLGSASAACSRAAPAPGDTLVLLASRTFADSQAAAALLDELAAATDILGPARFEIISAPEARAQDFPRLLSAWRPASGAGHGDGHGDGDDHRDDREEQAERERPGLRAVLAVLGDLSLLQGVDPSLSDRTAEALTSRVVDLEALDRALEHLAREAARRGGVLALASAPLGLQGRVELPELVAVAERYAARPGVTDLRTAFVAFESQRLFTNGIDRLDAAGQAVFARTLFAALCDDPGPIAPRDAAEHRARAQARALQHLAQGRKAEAAEALAAARGWTQSSPKPTPKPTSSESESPSPSPTPTPSAVASEARAAVRELALILALDGPGAARQRRAELGDLAPVPGLALIERLLAQPDGAPPSEPFEAALVAVFDAAQARAPQAARLAKTLTEDHPQRVEAWMLLELAGFVASPPFDVRDSARTALARVPPGIGVGTVSFEAADALFDDWPHSLNAHPALYLATQPFTDLPTPSP